jgi:homoserine dehydrogenase
MSNNTYVQRRATLSRLLRQVEDGRCSLEHALGEAFSAGYLQGSEQADLSTLDAEILSVIAATETPVIESIRQLHPTLAEAVDAARLAEMNLAIEGAAERAFEIGFAL